MGSIIRDQCTLSPRRPKRLVLVTKTSSVHCHRALPRTPCTATCKHILPLSCMVRWHKCSAPIVYESCISRRAYVEKHPSRHGTAVARFTPDILLSRLLGRLEQRVHLSHPVYPVSSSLILRTRRVSSSTTGRLPLALHSPVCCTCCKRPGAYLYPLQHCIRCAT